jgi:hypothetical protein
MHACMQGKVIEGAKEATRRSSNGSNDGLIKMRQDGPG